MIDHETRLPVKAVNQGQPERPRERVGTGAQEIRKPIFLDAASPSDMGDSFRAQGYPFMVSGGSLSATSGVDMDTMRFPEGKGSVTVLDSPGFCDVRSAVDLNLTDSSICASVAQALARDDLPLRGVTAILLFVGNPTREDTTLARQMLVLQLSFGPEVWRRVVFVFKAVSERGDTMDDVARCSDIVRPLLVKITRSSAAFDATKPLFPVVLTATDTPVDVMKKVLWALDANLVSATSRAVLTYGATTCKKCGATNDKFMVKALASYGERTMEAAVGKCHPRFDRANLDVSSRVVNGVLFGLLGPATVPVHLLGGFLGWLVWDSWRDSDNLGVHDLKDWLMYAPRATASVFHGMDMEKCSRCGRSRNSVGCVDIEVGGLQHEFHSPPQELEHDAT